MCVRVVYINCLFRVNISSKSNHNKKFAVTASGDKENMFIKGRNSEIYGEKQVAFTREESVCCG